MRKALMQKMASDLNKKIILDEIKEFVEWSYENTSCKNCTFYGDTKYCRNCHGESYAPSDDYLKRIAIGVLKIVENDEDSLSAYDLI